MPCKQLIMSQNSQTESKTEQNDEQKTSTETHSQQQQNSNNVVNNEEKKTDINATASFIIPIPIDRQPTRTFKAWKMKGCNFTLQGYSRAADKTYFCVPQMKLGLDGGYCRGRLQNNLFLTHGHFDHSHDIPYMTTHQKGMNIYCPNEITNYISDYCKSFIQLNCAKTLPNKPEWDFTINGCNNNDYKLFGPKIKNKNKKQNNNFIKKNSDKYRAKCFICHHAVPCLGFMFDEKRRRKKQKYKDLNFKTHKNEILQLKKDGIEIMEEYYLRLFVYVGDTNINVFKTTPMILEYPIVIIECTFLYDKDRSFEQLEKDGHINWTQLKPYCLKYINVTFVIIHFSCRYKELEIIEFFNKENKEIQRISNGKNSLKNCVIWACKQDDGTQKVIL
eukprot:238676_1